MLIHSNKRRGRRDGAASTIGSANAGKVFFAKAGANFSYNHPYGGPGASPRVRPGLAGGAARNERFTKFGLSAAVPNSTWKRGQYSGRRRFGVRSAQPEWRRLRRRGASLGCRPHPLGGIGHWRWWLSKLDGLLPFQFARWLTQRARRYRIGRPLGRQCLPARIVDREAARDEVRRGEGTPETC